jgi:hypothetical protein
MNRLFRDLSLHVGALDDEIGIKFLDGFEVRLTEGRHLRLRPYFERACRKPRDANHPALLAKRVK